MTVSSQYNLILRCCQIWQWFLQEGAKKTLWSSRRIRAIRWNARKSPRWILKIAKMKLIPYKLYRRILFWHLNTYFINKPFNHPIIWASILYSPNSSFHISHTTWFINLHTDYMALILYNIVLDILWWITFLVQMLNSHGVPHKISLDFLSITLHHENFTDTLDNFVRSEVISSWVCGS